MCQTTTFKTKVVLSSIAAAALAFTASNAFCRLLDNDVDPANLGKGDYIYVVTSATNQLGGSVTNVHDIPSLMNYEASQGMRYIVVKAGTGSTNFNGGGSSPQFDSNLVYQAHQAGLKIFSYDRSYGTDVPGEIAIGTNALNLGADGHVVDAEIEWESANLANNTTAATNLLQGIKNVYPNRFLGHSPFMYISMHSSFPYKQFGLYCDGVAPQDYWNSFAISPLQCVSDMNTEWNNWQNGLSGGWTAAVKPIAPIGEADTTAIPGSEITTFVQDLKTNTSPATAGGYKGVAWWRADLHTASQWTSIASGNIGESNAVTIVDNPAATVVGTWSTGASAIDRYWVDYRFKSQGTGTAYLQFTPNLPVAGDYQVFEWHNAGSNRTTNAPCTINYNGGNTTVNVSQKVNGGRWISLGTYNFLAGTSGNVQIKDNIPDSTQIVVADAVKFVLQPPSVPSAVTGTAVGGAQIDVTWTDNSSNEEGFVIYHATTSGGPYTAVGSVGANTTSFSDTGLASGTTYYYVVRSINAGGSSANSAEGSATTSGTVADIIVDNPAATVVGTWTTGTSSTDKYGADYRDKSQGTGSAYLQFTPTILTGGDYNVYEWHPQGSNRTTNAPVVVSYNGGTTTVNVNQKVNGGTWVLLGKFNFVSGTFGYVQINDNFPDAGQLVMADAIKWVYVPPPTLPAAPSGLTATAVSSSQINLSWTDNSGNEDNFIVSRSTTSGGPYTDIATLAANTTSYSDTGLSQSTTYYYVVRASNSTGSSANSNQASATTLLAPPAAPSGLTATTISASQINLAWTDNSSNEGGFVIGRSTTSGGPYTDVASVGANVTAYNNTGLAAATTYYYVVRATNSAGSSANSAQASATTLPLAPAAPSGLTATAASSSQINLSWTDNSNNEDNFIVARSSTTGGPYTDIATVAANATSYNNTGLSANTTYYYVVRAVNTGGSSANSAEASATTLPLPPTAPSGLTATAASSTQINLSWTDNSNNEANFIVARSGTSGGPYTDVATLGANVTSYNDTGLTANTTYYYVVRASNTGGSSANSTEASATTLPLAPAAPSGLTATAASSSQINLAWTDNSNNEDNFIVGRSSTSGGPYTDIATVAANATSYNNTGLSANTTYYYVVRAVNTGGASANSAQASATTLPLPPTAPSGLTAATISASQINLAWTDNSNNESNFIVGRSTTSGGPYTDVATVAANATAYNDTGLAAATTYYYVVRASNAGGSSANSAQASATTLPLPPTAPSGLTASAVSSSQINLSWTDNSNNEANFIVARSATSGGPYTDIATLAANTTTYNNTGLSGGTTYFYVVRATNTGGSSANSAQASAITFPGAPSGLTAVAQTTTQIKLTWTDNSTNETAMVVGRSTTSGGPYTDIASLAANTTVYTNTGLATNTTYYYVVRATNSAGSSPNSAQATATTPSDIIIDNGTATVAGTWSTASSSTDKYGADYRYKSQGTGTAYLEYRPSITVSGNWQIYEWHPQGSNRTTNAPIVITYSGGTVTNFVNQQVNGGKWNAVGAVRNFNTGTNGFVRIQDNFPDTGQIVMADAIKLVKVP